MTTTFITKRENISQQIRPDISTSELLYLMSEDEKNELMAMAQRHEEMRWDLGFRCERKITVRGWPVRQTCALYAQMAKYRNERSVREFYYCAKFYLEEKNRELYNEYVDRLDWCVMNFARLCENPSQVLHEAAEKGYTIDQLKIIYKPSKKDPELEKGIAPRPAHERVFLRFIHAVIPPAKIQEAEKLFELFLAGLKELMND